MSDPASGQTEPQDISQQISTAPEKLWKRLRASLKVETRQEAIELVAQDQAAATAARTILASATEDILTRTTKPDKALLNTSRKRAPEDVLYGGPKGSAELTI